MMLQRPGKAFRLALSEMCIMTGDLDNCAAVDSMSNFLSGSLAASVVM